MYIVQVCPTCSQISSYIQISDSQGRRRKEINRTKESRGREKIKRRSWKETERTGREKKKARRSWKEETSHDEGLKCKTSFFVLDICDFLKCFS